MLTSQQIADRAGKLTASRVACLMTGDKAKINQLYLEMIGEAVPENLDHVWPVQLGMATELLNLEWYEGKHTSEPLSRRGMVLEHPEHRWAAATLDGWDVILQCPVECKHCGGREPIDPTIIDRYQPQMQWQMWVTGATQCALSVIMGANEPEVRYIERDENYIKILTERAAAFMLCVKTKTPPVALDPVPAPALPGTKVYDMTGNNHWASLALDWLESQTQAERYKHCTGELKRMVPDDARKCHGHGVQITRDRAGRLSLRESE